MKHHKKFRNALWAAIQECRAQYPEMGDADTIKALNAIVGSLKTKVTRQKKAAEVERLNQWYAAYKQRNPEQQEQHRAEYQERLRLAQAEVQERLRQSREAFEAQHAKRMAEREAERALALRLVDEGYRSLAKQMHPDQGGSHEMMTRLNKVRGRQKATA